MEETKKKIKVSITEHELITVKPADGTHLGSSNAFEETENPLSRDSDNISDEKLDELLEND